MGTPPAPPLLLLILLPFLLSSATPSDQNDVVCLTKFLSSLNNPTKTLTNWTETNLGSPCPSSSSDSPLPGATCNNGRIFKISLPNLSLSGSLSPFLSNCSNLQSLDLSSNLLSSSIPPSLSLLSNLAVLNLSFNLLSSSIPTDLSSCLFLNVIDLHHNLLSGPIPSQLSSLSRLSSFDVSDNQLSGPIPYLPRFNSSSFRGNKGLFGYPLDPIRPDKGLSVTAIVGIGLGSGFLSLVVSFIAVCVWLRLSERKLAAQEAKISHLMPDY